MRFPNAIDVTNEHQKHLALHDKWLEQITNESRQADIELRDRVKDLEEKVAWLIENMHVHMTTGGWPKPE